MPTTEKVLMRVADPAWLIEADQLGLDLERMAELGFLDLGCTGCVELELVGRA